MMASVTNKQERNKALVLEALYPVQQARLRRGGALLLAHIHPAQRAHRTQSRRPRQPHQEHAADAEIRARGDRG